MTTVGVKGLRFTCP